MIVTQMAPFVSQNQYGCRSRDICAQSVRSRKAAILAIRFQIRQQEPETGLFFFFNLLNCLHLLQSSIEGKAVVIFNIIVLHPEMAHKWGGSITNSYVS